MRTQEHRYVRFHNPCASTDKKHADYKARQATCAVDPLRKSRASHDT